VRNAYRDLVGKHKEKIPLGRSKHKWDGKIKMYLREIGFECVDWIEFHALLTLALIGGEWSASCLDCFMPRERAPGHPAHSLVTI
jgi:hypothetical protein